MINNQQSFKAYPYLVEIWESGELRHSLSIQDASGTYRSIQLDEHEQASKAALKKFESLNKTIQAFIEENPDKEQGELTEDEQKMFNSLKEITRLLNQLSFKYVQLTIKDWKDKGDIVDSVNPAMRNEFFSCIRMASFGLTSEKPTKKKSQLVKSTSAKKRSNSKSTASKRKKQKNGTRSK